MTFLPDPAYSPADQSKRVKEISPWYIRNPPETIVDVTNLADNDAHEKYVDMDGFDCIMIQILTNNGYAEDNITISLDSTITPTADPTTGVDWVGDDDAWTTDQIDNSQAAIDRIDKIIQKSPTWYRLTYQRTAGAVDDADITVNIKRWKN